MLNCCSPCSFDTLAHCHRLPEHRSSAKSFCRYIFLLCCCTCMQYSASFSVYGHQEYLFVRKSNSLYMQIYFQQLFRVVESCTAVRLTHFLGRAILKRIFFTTNLLYMNLLMNWNRAVTRTQKEYRLLIHCVYSEEFWCCSNATNFWSTERMATATTRARPAETGHAARQKDWPQLDQVTIHQLQV